MNKEGVNINSQITQHFSDFVSLVSVHPVPNHPEAGYRLGRFALLWAISLWLLSVYHHRLNIYSLNPFQVPCQQGCIYFTLVSPGSSMEGAQ